MRWALEGVCPGGNGSVVVVVVVVVVAVVVVVMAVRDLQRRGSNGHNTDDNPSRRVVEISGLQKEGETADSDRQEKGRKSGRGEELVCSGRKESVVHQDEGRHAAKGRQSIVIRGPGTGTEPQEMPETTLTQTKTRVCQLKPAAKLAMTPETNSTGRSRGRRSPNPASETSRRLQQASHTRDPEYWPRQRTRTHGGQGTAR